MFDLVQTALADWKQQTEDAIRRLQRENGVLLQSLAAQSMPLDAQHAAIPGETARTELPTPAARVLAVAAHEWERGVHEPFTPGDACAQIIDGYIRGADGLGWGTTDVRTWRPGVPYRKNLDFAWCGAFAARCWSAGGLLPRLRRDHLAGTDRLWRWARGTKRLITHWEDLLPGDIMVVGHGGKPPGGHITIVRGFGKASIDTYEGNAVGEAPPGARDASGNTVPRWEGVVRGNRRHVPADGRQTFCFGVRPLAELGDLA